MRRHSRAFRPTVDGLETKLCLDGTMTATLVPTAAVLDFNSGHDTAWGLASLSGPVSMPNSTYHEKVYWGDGSVSLLDGSALGTATFANGAPENGYGTVTADHVYNVTQDSTFEIEVEVINTSFPDPDCTIDVTTYLTAHVHANDTTVAAASGVTFASGVASSPIIATISDPPTFGAAPASQFIAVVWWGDGTAADQSPKVVDSGTPGTYNVVGTHTFAAPGTYTVQTEVLDLSTWAAYFTTETVIVN